MKVKGSDKKSDPFIECKGSPNFSGVSPSLVGSVSRG